MEFFGIVDVFRDYCDANNIGFIYGIDEYANAIGDESQYASYGLILTADFNSTPTMVGGRVVECGYTGTIALGIKSDGETESSLDETPIQKYDRRLKYLTTRLTSILGTIACENELIISTINIRFDMNRFDLNADFVAATITITH